LEESNEDILVVSHTQEEVNVVTPEHQTKVLSTMNIADKPIKLLIDSSASGTLPIKFHPVGSNLGKTEHILKMCSMKALGTLKNKITNPKENGGIHCTWLILQSSIVTSPHCLDGKQTKK